MKRKLLFVVILGASLLVATLFGKNVLAADRDTIIKKWQFTQYVQCAKDGGFNAYFVSQSDNPANRNYWHCPTVRTQAHRNHLRYGQNRISIH